MDIYGELTGEFPKELVTALLAAYVEIESSYSLQKWKASELDSGHFVEAARRMLEHQLFGKYTPIGKSLPGFSDQTLRRYESATGSESYRMLIPRVLKSIYNIRNKRGVGHLGLVSPNEMDATYILYASKWVLAEFTRLSSHADPSVVQREIQGIVERKLGVLWKHSDIVRVLDSNASARDQVLIFLYDQSPLSGDVLQSRTGYKNKSNFKKILRRLHASMFIHHGDDNQCIITPLGQREAEELIARSDSSINS